jgi:hypothetical protein
MSNLPRLIGLCGHARAGKDTVAKLVQRVEPITEIMAFADPLKKICANVFGFSWNQLYGDARDRPDTRYTLANGQPLTARYALQRLGTDWGRDCDPEIWIKYGLRRARKLREKGYAVVITDVRFLNEAEAITHEDGDIWKVVRPGADGQVGIVGHASEAEIPTIECDRIIHNDGTLEDLLKTVSEVLV